MLECCYKTCEFRTKEKTIEMGEQWSFVGNKSNQHWLWHAVDHKTNTGACLYFARSRLRISNR